jgi:hypothetical protein
MKDSQGIMLRERWKENGNRDCAHTSLSQERSFAGVITGSYICTLCGAQTIPNGVEASSVLELNLLHRFIERRKARHVLATRGLASFVALNASLETIDGDAILHDISLGGCRLETEPHQPLVEGQLYHLTLSIPPQMRLIHVSEAMPCWHQGRFYGVKFIQPLPECDSGLIDAMFRLNAVLGKEASSERWMLSLLGGQNDTQSGDLT